MNVTTPRVSLPAALRSLIRRSQQTTPVRAAPLARAAWLGAGTLPLLGCLTSFSIGASKATTPIPGVSYRGGFEAGWRHAVNQPAYFTWMSNALVAATSLTLAARREAPSADSFWAARTAGLGSVMITGIVYNSVLRGAEQGTALYRFNDTVQHIVNPVLAPLVWALFDPRGQITGRRVRLGAAIPLAWATMTMARGPRIDWYPYPFLDVARLGRRTVGLTLSGILAVFLSMTASLGLLDRRLAG
ncbi:Pr6Pr family membrane protein [uncultured Micrococcus sp.]|uniref:Pr6Pr family membrane protein n=1 Tax=uncultured Micrococcus sp. TaxID=114051 RepID=UPI0025955C82|nr:Pr6Pr family membrane protein [uncultured Micrococcus sp.]